MGISTNLLHFMFDLVIIDEGVDDIYLWRWAVTRMVRMKIGRYMYINRFCVHGEQSNSRRVCRINILVTTYMYVCNVMRFDCKGKAPSRVSARRRRTAKSSSLHT